MTQIEGFMVAVLQVLLILSMLGINFSIWLFKNFFFFLCSPQIKLNDISCSLSPKEPIFWGEKKTKIF